MDRHHSRWWAEFSPGPPSPHPRWSKDDQDPAQPARALLRDVAGPHVDAKQRHWTEDQVREDYNAARFDFLKRESLLRIS